MMTTFAAAVRAVLANESDRSDMRSIGRRAAEILGDDLVFEAAVTHLTQLARREWNRSLTGDGGPDSDEVVVLHGQDARLGDLAADDRAWVAEQRERLSLGLWNRAADIRAFRAGRVIDVTQSAVLSAERRARSLSALVQAVERLDESDNAEMGARLTRAVNRTDALHAEGRLLDVIAARIVAASDLNIGTTSAIRRAINRLAVQREEVAS